MMLPSSLQRYLLRMVCRPSQSDDQCQCGCTHVLDATPQELLHISVVATVDIKAPDQG